MGTRHLEIVAEDEHGDAGAQRTKPLDQHLSKLLRVLLRDGVEEIATQEIKCHAAFACPHVALGSAACIEHESNTWRLGWSRHRCSAGPVPSVLALHKDMRCMAVHPPEEQHAPRLCTATVCAVVKEIVLSSFVEVSFRPLLTAEIYAGQARTKYQPKALTKYPYGFTAC